MLQSKKKRAEIGAVFVEAAIILPLFFILLFASMQLIVISWRQLQVQFLAARLVRILAVPDAGTDATNTASRCNIVLGSGVPIDARNANAQAPGFNATPTGGQAAAISYLTGAAATPTPGCGYPPGSIIILTLTYDMQLFFQKFLTFGLPNIKLRGTAVGVAQGTIT